MSQCSTARMRPCKSCPFSRKVTPGELGGSSPMVYVGQTQGPFILNCHSGPDYDDPAKRGELGIKQCAGAAIFRANIGVDDNLPHQLLRLNADKTAVFSSHEEFVAHHTCTPVEVVAEVFASIPPNLFLVTEMQKVTSSMVRLVERC